MASRCDRRAATAALALVVLAGAPAARAEPACETMTLVSLMEWRYGIEPSPRDHLGLELRAGLIDIAWGGGCDGRRHALRLVEAETPDYADEELTILRVGTYRLGWEGDGWTVHVGLRGAVRWGDSWRFATVVAGGSLRIGDALLRAQLDLGGLSLVERGVSLGGATDLALEASAVWPDHAASRGEVRLRVRDRALPGGRVHDDVTVTAGVGLAAAARDHVRALPGFVGLAVRSAEERTTLVVAEWSLGVGPP